MRKYTKKVTMTFILISVCALSIFSCKREPPTVPAEPPTASESTVEVTLGTTTQPACFYGHSISDGVCTGCGLNVHEFEFKLSEDGSCYTLTKLKYSLIPNVEVPAYYQGKPVKAIGDGAFKSLHIGRVALPEGIVSIGDEAFYECFMMPSINLPDSLESIGRNAFKLCNNLDELTIPESLKSIGEGAFTGCKIERVEVKSFGAWCAIDFEDLESNPMHKGALLTMGGEPISKIVFGETDKEIKRFTFAGCTNLLNVVFSESLTSIGEGAFYGCTSLEQISIPKNTEIIGKRAFENCTQLFEIAFDGTLAEWNTISLGDDWNEGIAKYTLKCNDATEDVKLYSTGLEYTLNEKKDAYILSGIGTCTDTEIIIPSLFEGNPVVLIKDYALAGNEKITKVIIPGTVTEIGAQAFSECSSLEEVILYEGVQIISDRAFGSCSTLISVTLPKSVCEIHREVFLGCYTLTDIRYDGTKADFDNINKWDIWAVCQSPFLIHCADAELSYAEATNASDLEFTLAPDRYNYYVTGRGNCSGSLIIVPAQYNGKPVKRIDTEAFRYDRTLKTVILSEGLTAIGKGAFQYSGIKDITIPSTLKTVNDYAFENTEIEIVRISSPESWCNIMFSNPEANPLSRGASLFMNGEPLTNIAIDGSVTIIGKYQFAGCTSIQRVILSEGTQSIAKYAFSECKNLQVVEFPNNLKTIGEHAFELCTSLTALELPDGLQLIESYAFNGCSSLYKITFPPSLAYLRSHAFSYCTSLTEFITPEKVTDIDASFLNCNGLKKIYFHKGVKTLKNNSFNSLTKMTEIIYDGTKEEWSNKLSYAFSLFYTPYNVYCTDGMFKKGEVSTVYPFDRKLSTDGKHYVINGKGDCTDSGIVIDGTYNNLPVTEIADGAFEGEAHSIIYVCDGIASIGKNAFKNCKDTVYVRLPNTLKAIGDGAFDGISDTARIVFDGTIAEWNAISGNFKGVICTDGTAE